MLRFFYTYQHFSEVQTSGASLFSLLSAEKFRNKIIPFNLIYVTSSVYLRKINSALPDESDELKVMNEAQVQAVCSHDRFPKDLHSQGENSLKKIQQQTADQDEVNIVVVNGIGTGFGDNYVGLGAIQRLQALMSPKIVNVFLMNNANMRVSKVYMRAPNIFLLNNCVSLKKFMQMDYFINLTGMVGFPEFDQMPLIRFMADRFGVDRVSDVQELQPKLPLDLFKLKTLKQYLISRFNRELAGRPVVYFHPQASTPIRNIPKKYADVIVQSLIAHGFNVITAIPYGYKANEFHSIDEVSNDIDDLLHIIACCDAVVSVGTVVYHLSAAMDKPTILIPSVQADVKSGQVMPQVNTWLPEQSKSLIINKHKGRDTEDLAIAEKIWRNIDPIKLSKKLQHMLASSKQGVKIEND